jgi:signal transduction protein with GAF and PtsI domain
MTDGKLRVYDERTQEYTILDDGSSWGKIQTPETQLEVKQMTHEEMLSVAAEREKENQVLEIAKNFMEEHKEAFQHLAAIERKELVEKSFDELTKDQRIQLALEEVDWIVIGGQDGEEFYGSIQFIRKVLRSLRTLEEPSQGHTRTDLDAL